MNVWPMEGRGDSENRPKLMENFSFILVSRLVCVNISSTCSGSFCLTKIPTDALFCADWEYDNDENRGCQNDGFQPAYMTDNHENWMYQTLEACCEQHYG